MPVCARRPLPARGLTGEDPALLADYLTPERVDVHRVARRRRRWSRAATAWCWSSSSPTWAATAAESRPTGTSDCWTPCGLPRAVTLIGFDTSMAVTAACVIPPSRRAGPHAAARPGAAARPARALGRAAAALAELLERARHGLGRRDRDRGRRRAGNLHRAADRGRHRARSRAGAGRAAASRLLAGGARGRHRGGRGGCARHAAAAADRREARAGVRLALPRGRAAETRVGAARPLSARSWRSASRRRRNPRWPPETGR